MAHGIWHLHSWKMGTKKHRRKHIPQRTCVACRQKKDKRQLTRIVRTPDSGIVVDFTGKRNGRGAYLCDTPACWEKALNSKLLDKALRTEVTDTEKESLAEHRPAASPANG